ncbi:MAG: hypothetical protein V4508_19675 [Pseudomonadota bacterium]
MNILKHMEAAFVVALGLASSAAFMAGSLPTAHAHAPTAVSASATPSDMMVVVVSAKHMSAEEKLQSLQEEQRLAIAHGSSARRM